MALSIREYLCHVLDEANFIESQTLELELSDFLSDESAKRAFVRSIEIIGKAVKQIPREVREAIPRFNGS
jgi:uncharacterized protein with HEPN domain